MTGSLPSQEVDHLNHVRDDNRWANLRQASRKQNCKNKGRYANSSKIYPGVAWSERAKKWIATIWSDGKQTHIGTFTGPDEAILARKHAEKAHGFHINHAAMTTGETTMSTYAVFGMTEHFAREEARKKTPTSNGRRELTMDEGAEKVEQRVARVMAGKRVVQLSGMFDAPPVCRAVHQADAE